MLKGNHTLRAAMAALLAVLMLVSLCPAAVLAEGETPTAVIIENGDMRIPYMYKAHLSYSYDPWVGLAEDVTWTVADESIVKLEIDEWGWASIQAIGVGETTVTLTTESGLTDTVGVSTYAAIPWGEESTRMVYLNPTYPMHTFAFSVAEEGEYEFFSEGDGVTWGTIYDEEGMFLSGFGGSTSDNNFRGTAYLEQDVTYYLLVEEGDHTYVSFPITMQKYNPPAGDGDEIPEEGVWFKSETLTLSLGTRFDPMVDCGWNEDGSMIQIVSSDESVVALDPESGRYKAMALGTATLTATVPSGATDTLTVTVEAPSALSLDTPEVFAVDGEVKYYMHTFIPETDGTYVFRSSGEGADPCITIYNSEGEVIGAEDDTNGLHFVLAQELEAGQVYYVELYHYNEEYPYELLVTEGVPATSIALEANKWGAFHQKDGVYYVKTGDFIMLEVVFAPDNSIPQELEFSIDKEEAVDYFEAYETCVDLHPIQSGPLTITAQTADGALTATVTIMVVDCLAGDLNFDNIVDKKDRAILEQALAEEIDLGHFLAAADMNGDCQVDEADLALFPLLGDVNGDGEVTSTDARMVLQYSVEKISADALDLTKADVDGNGEYTSTDARLILQYSVNKMQEFPVETNA